MHSGGFHSGGSIRLKNCMVPNHRETVGRKGMAAPLVQRPLHAPRCLGIVTDCYTFPTLPYQKSLHGPKHETDTEELRTEKG